MHYPVVVFRSVIRCNAPYSLVFTYERFHIINGLIFFHKYFPKLNLEKRVANISLLSRSASHQRIKNQYRFIILCLTPWPKTTWKWRRHIHIWKYDAIFTLSLALSCQFAKSSNVIGMQTIKFLAKKQSAIDKLDWINIPLIFWFCFRI